MAKQFLDTTGVQELVDNLKTTAGDGLVKSGNSFSIDSTFLSYLRKQTFATPSISSFSLVGTNTSGSKEVGTTVTLTSINYNVTNTSNVSGNLTLSRNAAVGNSAKTLSTSISKSGSSATIRESFTAATSGTVKYTLSAPYTDTNGSNKNATKEASISFYWPVFYGATSSSTPSNTDGLIKKGSSFGTNMLEISTSESNPHIHFLSTGTIKLYNSLKLPITPGATGTVSITVNNRTTTYNYATIQNCGSGTQKIYVNI